MKKSSRVACSSVDQPTESNINLSETIGGTTLPKDGDLRILTYKTLLEKFNQKYSRLNTQQKSLLRAYINKSGQRYYAAI